MLHNQVCLPTLNIAVDATTSHQIRMLGKVERLCFPACFATNLNIFPLAIDRVRIIVFTKMIVLFECQDLTIRITTSNHSAECARAQLFKDFQFALFLQDYKNLINIL